MFIFSQKSRKLHGPVGRIFCSVFFAMIMVFTGTNAVALPSGYTELEYIESTGTQYINTGFKPTADFKHTLVFEVVSGTNSQKYICGTGVNEGRSGNVRVTGNTIDGIYIHVGSGAAKSLLQSAQTLSGKTTLVLDLHNNATNTVLLNNRNVANSNTGTITSSSSMQLFGMGGSYLTNGVRIYNSVIEQNGRVVRHMVPAKRNNDNAIGMYDVENDVFYPNAGSGVFTAGPVVKVKIASKTYSTNKFAPIKTQMAQIVTDVNTIVNTTITQANGIETLATTKQDRPATNCPAGRKCLLVKTPTGEDAWYPIAE